MDGYVAVMERREMLTEFLWGKPKKGCRYENQFSEDRARKMGDIFRLAKKLSASQDGSFSCSYFSKRNEEKRNAY